MKGLNLPIDTVGLLVLAIVFIALVFALISKGVMKEVGRLNRFAENNAPEVNTGSETEGTSFSGEIGEIPVRIERKKISRKITEEVKI